MNTKTKGFTLIELLVVIAIIATLSTVVMAGLNSARAKGRDAKRLSDVKALQKALELYYDNCGGYPGLGSAVIGSAGGLELTTADGTCDVTNEFSTVMNPLPVNPLPNGADYTYCSMAEDSTVGVGSCDATKTTSYQITFSIENEAGSLTTAGAYILTPSGIQGPV